ncbi:PDZ domain-containing protein 7-like isoform X7 [Penaeus chinensis]|uniref:PDZ domain-containing protein 7-like isoform X7 n=1 Tax=Penaeus chinensis TaxID=139456 RepID=UPI001FB657E4|nr:PDZ domain-containing protein 7-like isoform X7 [Penaeus chinensis]
MRDGGLMGIGEPLEASRGHAFATHAPSISSAASTMGGGRVRFVRLIRRPGESYGFSLRGGREHGTGFFISHVEVGSEAYMQGLRAGDQLLRVNNLSVERAVHHEVTAMVQGKSSVVLKLKSAGIIPVKEHRGDPLTWLVVDDDEDLSDHGTDTYSQSLPSTHESEHEQFDQASPTQPSVGHGGNENHARVYISCTGKVGLGCSICKGPAEKPGIFVQSVRGGGVARNAGLRPGDQIIACNDVSFTHLEFAEAVYVLKSSPRLVLDVIRGAGLELVAGESSGYNSSASSVAGDQTPPSSSSSEPRDSDHSVTNRLSAVSRHLTLDRSRGWREIESEWAEAEAQEKRRVLQTNQRTLKTRAQRDANHRIGSSLSSRSLGNLSAALREEEDEEQRTAFRDGPTSQAHPSPARGLLTPTHAHYKPALRSTRSSSDVTDDTSHKIALVTSADPHVNNIVVTTGPKNERDAVSRLDQLSNPSASSRTSTLSSGSSQVTVRSSCGSGGSPTVGKAVSRESLVEQQLRELREEQRRLQEEANRLAQERRKFEEAQSGASEDSKAQVIQEKIDAFKKEKVKSGLGGHNSAQHDKLMQEFKIAHKKMFVSKENLRDISSEEDKEKKETKPEAKPVNHVKVTETPLVQREFTSKIISNSTINKTPLRAMNNVSKTPSLMNGLTTPAKTNFLIRDANSNVNGKTPIANTYSPNVKTSLPSSSPSTNQVSPSSIPLPPPPPPPPPLHHHRSQPPIVPAKPNPKTSVNSPHTQPMSASTSSHSISRPKSMAMSNSGLGHSPHQSRSPASGVPPPPPPMPGMCTLLPPAQQTEQLGGIIKNQSTSAVSTPTKSPLRPHGGVVLDEFRPGEKNSLSVKPPNTYFDAGKQTPGKPLVSIGAYPSPNHRPPPVKMDFLPSASANGEQIAGAAKTSHTPVKVKLQSELESTLSRSNLRQRFAAQELPPDPPSEASGTKQESTSAGYTTTTITNNNTSPSASLSSKYRTLGQDAPSVTIMKGGSGKENEAPDSPPTGILKASGPSSIRPLQKSISFGDVTTVGEDDPRT